MYPEGAVTPTLCQFVGEANRYLGAEPEFYRAMMLGPGVSIQAHLALPLGDLVELDTPVCMEPGDRELCCFLSEVCVLCVCTCWGVGVYV